MFYEPNIWATMSTKEKSFSYIQEKERLERKKKRHVLTSEKKRGDTDTISDSLTKVIREELGIQSVKDVEIIQEYELAWWLTDKERDIAKHTIFWDTPLNDVLDCAHNDFHKQLTKDKKYLRITTVDGQYNAREDYTKQCLMTVKWFDPATQLRCNKIIVFTGDVSDEEVEKIKNYISNPLEEKTLSINNDNLIREVKEADDVATIAWFTQEHWEDHTTFIQNIAKQYSLAMSIEDLECVYQYFNKEEQRDPTIVELKVLDNYRSDHCRHTTFNTKIDKVTFAKNDGIFKHIQASEQSYQETRKALGRWEKPNTLMELAQINTRLLKANPDLNPNIKNLTISDENNACSFTTMIEKEDGTQEERRILFKNETHNHPTEIAPYGWAATCVWWCIRDPLSGRARVFQAMRISWSADPTQPIDQTIAGKLPQKVISTMAALWFSSYGNQIWLAAWEVREYFNPWFLAKRFEVGYVIAWVPNANVQEAKPKKWDKVILIWWKTWRDAVGAAWWSSKIHDESSITTAWTEVQRGNPVEERKINKLFLDPRFSRYIKKCNDGGAGGISVMVWELASGITIDLDKVPLKYAWLDGTEIALAESQERMAIIIDPEHYDEAMKYIEEYNLEWTHIGDVTNDKKHPENDRLIMQRRWKDILNIKRDFLEQAGAERTMEEIIIDGKSTTDFFDFIPQSVKQANTTKDKFLANLRRKEVASQQWLQGIFDNSVWAGTVLAPYGGKYQTSPQVGMVARVPSFDGINKTTTISTHWFNPTLADESAYLQSMYAVILAVSKQVALGWDYKKIWFSLQEYFGKLQQDSERRWHPYSALLWAREAMKQLNLSAIGGKDSMSGTYKTQDKTIHVPDSVVAFAANIGSVDKVVSAEFKNPYNKVVCFQIPRDENGIIDFDIYKQQLEIIQWAIDAWVVKSSNVVEEWWIAASVAKMCFGNDIWFQFNEKIVDQDLYATSLWSIVLEMERDYSLNLKECTVQDSIKIIGETLHWIDGIQLKWWVYISLQEALDARQQPLASVFPTTSGWGKVAPINITKKAKEREETWTSYNKIKRSIGEALNINILKTKPKILIPIFPGTNSEMDTAHRIIQSGMDPVLFTLQNLTPEQLQKSAQELARLIEQTEWLILAGWFSAWDEPDGSGKYIASIMRMPVVKDALNEYFAKKTKLTLGICNGFQWLIKSGVFKNWQIEDHLDESDVTLTYNTNRRHITDLTGIKITSVLSPMLEYVNIGDVYRIPSSHGEWNLVWDPKTIQHMIQNGQIFAQYVDHDYNPSNTYNGSTQGIAGITSKNGLIGGMMPHPERSDKKLFQNVPWNGELPIFKWMAKWFGVQSYKK